MTVPINITDTKTVDELIANMFGQIVLLNDTPRHFPFKLVMDGHNLNFSVGNVISIYLWFENSFPQPSPYLTEFCSNIFFDNTLGTIFNIWLGQDGGMLSVINLLSLSDNYFEFDYDGSTYTIKDINGNVMFTGSDDHVTIGYIAWNPASIVGSPTGSVTMTFQELISPPTPSPSEPSLSDAVTNIITAVSTVIGEISNSIAANAETIGELMVIIPVDVALMSLGSKVFKSITGWLKPESETKSDQNL